MKTTEQTPYERGFYEGSRALPLTNYANKTAHAEYLKGRVAGNEARRVAYQNKKCDGCFYCSRFGCNRAQGGHCSKLPANAHVAADS